MNNIFNSNPPRPQVPAETLKPLTRFCMTIGNLPSSYLESMTYYEQLTWLCDYLQNTVIPTINNNSDAVTELQNLYNAFTNQITEEEYNFEINITNLFNELRSFVTTYFDDLDVQEEINNKLDDLVQDGTMENLLENTSRQFYNNLQHYCNNLENEINTERTRIDNFERLENGSTTGDAELTDLRIGTNSHVYQNAGTSVRSQFINVQNSLSKINGVQNLTFSMYGWNFISNSQSPSLGSYSRTAHTDPIHLEKGDKIQIKNGFKYFLIYLSDNDNLYHNLVSNATTDRIIQESGTYYISLSYTPESNIDDFGALSEGFTLIKTRNGKIWEIDNNNYKTRASLTGLNDRQRNLLKKILENAVFVDDMEEDILSFVNDLAEKNELVISKLNKYISSNSGNGVISASQTMSLLKDYFINPTKKVTFFIDNGGNTPERNFLILLNGEGQKIDSFLMNNPGRTNIEWTVDLTSSNNYIEGFRLSIYNDYKDNCYAYDRETGDIIFAGANSIYAGKYNINEL